MDYSPNETLKTIRLIHFSLMAGVIFFSAVILFLYFDEALGAEPIEIIEYVPIFVFLMALPISSVMYKQALKNIDAQTNLKTKMTTFQTAHIMRVAILEGCALFAAVVAFINGNLYHLIIVGLVLAIFASKIPSLMMLESDLRLTSEDKEKFNR